MQPSPLDALHDVMPPNDVPWWPLSAASWVVIITIVLLLIITIRALYKAHCYKKAKKQAIAQSQTMQQDPQALHILLKRLTKHYYGTEVTTQSQMRWAKTLTQLCGQTFNEQELNSLYSPTPSPALTHKLVMAIKHFKLKEKINV